MEGGGRRRKEGGKRKGEGKEKGRGRRGEQRGIVGIVCSTYWHGKECMYHVPGGKLEHYALQMDRLNDKCKDTREVIIIVQALIITIPMPAPKLVYMHN